MACSWALVTLGQSSTQKEIRTTPLGVAASYGIGGRDIEFAFERGLNLFYWGSVRTSSFGDGLRAIGAKSRESLVLVTQTYERRASHIESSLDRALRSLKFSYTDILLLGWWNLPPSDAILDAAADMVRKGKTKAVMVSCHHRPTFAHLARDARIDVLMLRYNAAHPGAERDVFPLLPTPRKGIITYTATSWGQLLQKNMLPKTERQPTSTDCYRFVLSNPYVDATFTGPKNREELDLAIRALEQGPLSEDELAWMKRIGAHVRSMPKPHSIAMNLGDRLVNFISGFGFKTTGELPK